MPERRRLRFLFDVHVHRQAAVQLRNRGVDVEHAIDLGLGRSSDAEVLEHAISEDRLVVTRNYRHFVPLVEACMRRGREFPGVLLVSPSIPRSDAGAHVRAIERWIRESPPGTSPVAGAYGWLR